MQALALVHSIDNSAHPLFELLEFLAHFWSCIWISFNYHAQTILSKIRIEENIPNPAWLNRILTILIALYNTRVITCDIPHKDQTLCDWQFFIFFLVLILVIVVIANYETRHLVAFTVYVEGHLGNVDSCIYKLALHFLLACCIQAQLVQLAVAHGKAKHFFLHFSRHTVIENVFLVGHDVLISLGLLFFGNLLSGFTIAFTAKNDTF